MPTSDADPRPTALSYRAAAQHRVGPSPTTVFLGIFYTTLTVAAVALAVAFTIFATSIMWGVPRIRSDPLSPLPRPALGPALIALFSLFGAVVLGRRSWQLFTGRPQSPRKRSNATVAFDDESVTCRRPSGVVETVSWSDLKAVLVKTTSSGPLLDDVFFVLVGSNSGCVVPSESSGTDELIQRLQRLPNFDNQKLIEAMRCTDDREFLCWTGIDR